MAREQSPAFQFYPQDFLADDKVMAMTAAARGVYIVLLCHCWLNHEIPDDSAVVRRMGLYEGTHWHPVWKMVRRCFHLRDGMLIQPRVERERAKQAYYREMKAKAGRESANKRATEAQQTGNSTSTDFNPPSSSSSSSSFPSEVSKLVEMGNQKDSAETAANGNGLKPTAVLRSTPGTPVIGKQKKNTPDRIAERLAHARALTPQGLRGKAR